MSDDTMNTGSDEPTLPQIPRQAPTAAKRLLPYVQQAQAILRASLAFLGAAWQNAVALLSRLSPRQRLVTIAASALLGVCLACSICTVGILALPNTPMPTVPTQAPLQGNAPKSTTAPKATNTPAPTATNTPKPTATPDLYHPYVTTVATDAGKLLKALTDMSVPCQAGDVAGCRDAAKKVNDTVSAFQADLDKHPAPPCLKDSDTHLRAALALFKSGTQHAMDGIDDNDVGLIQQGTADITAGSDELTKATDATKAAKC